MSSIRKRPSEETFLVRIDIPLKSGHSRNAISIESNNSLGGFGAGAREEHGRISWKIGPLLMYPSMATCGDMNHSCTMKVACSRDHSKKRSGVSSREVFFGFLQARCAVGRRCRSPLPSHRPAWSISPLWRAKPLTSRFERHTHRCKNRHSRIIPPHKQPKQQMAFVYFPRPS